MKSKFFTLMAVAMMTLTLAFVASAQSQKKKGQETQPTRNLPPASAGPVALKTVNLTCKNPGSHQDVAKTPSIINDNSATVPVGTKVSWKASDGDKGTLTLDKPLAKGASVQVLGNPGQNYNCTAWYLGK